MKNGVETLDTQDVTIKLTSLAICTVSILLHLFHDGLFSISLTSSLAYYLVVLYTCSDDFLNQRKATKTGRFLHRHATTILAIIRVVLLSLCDASTVSLYFAYITLCLAFSDDTQYEVVEPCKLRHPLRPPGNIREDQGLVRLRHLQRLVHSRPPAPAG